MVSVNSKDHGHLPRLVKTVILAQAAVILSFTVAMYQEYVSNLYLQLYVIDLFRTNIVADAILSMVTVSVFAIGTFTLLGSMYSTKKLKKWSTLSEASEKEMEIPAMPSLETIPAIQRRTSSRPRRRKPRAQNDDLYNSMTKYADEHPE